MSPLGPAAPTKLRVLTLSASFSPTGVMGAAQFSVTVQYQTPAELRSRLLSAIGDLLDRADRWETERAWVAEVPGA